MTRHWHNPWPEARDVPLEALLIASANYDSGTISDPDRRLDSLRRMVASCGPKVDPYILPSPSGWHSLGIRYSNEGRDYLSLAASKGPLLDILLACSTEGVNPPLPEDSE